MSKRRNPEAEVLEWFQKAEPAVALAFYRIVRGILETRGVFKPEVAPRAAPAKKKAPARLLDELATVE